MSTTGSTMEEVAKEKVVDEFVEQEDYEEGEDSLTFSNGVIEKIVALSLADVDNIAGMYGGILDRVQDAIGMHNKHKGVTVSLTQDGSVIINVSVIMTYGAYAPQIFEDVKAAIVGAMDSMTGLPVAGVNLRIEDVLLPEEIGERSQSALLPAPAVAVAE